MLRQTINFLPYFERRASILSLFTWRRFWFINLFFITIFMAFYVYMLWELYQLSAQKEFYKTKLEQSSKTFLVLKGSYPPFLFGPDAQESLVKLQRELKVQESILETIANKASFADKLIAFSQATTDGIWLTEIHLDPSKSLLIKGTSINSRALQIYIAKLKTIKEIQTYSISVNNIDDASPIPGNDMLNFGINLTKKKE